MLIVAGRTLLTLPGVPVSRPPRSTESTRPTITTTTKAAPMAQQKPKQLERVLVHQSATSHYAFVDGQLTMCGQASWRFSGFASRKPLCDRCVRELVRIAEAS